MVQSVAPNNMRATAAAMFICANSLIGFGLGPPLFGLLSDFFAASGMAQAGIDTAVCAANPQLDACALAQAQGLRWSLLASTLLFFWSRSEERRVGKECVSTGRYRWSPAPEKKKILRNIQVL